VPEPHAADARSRDVDALLAEFVGDAQLAQSRILQRELDDAALSALSDAILPVGLAPR